jgi:hypothetical protein
MKALASLGVGLFFVFLTLTTAAAQNRFEGYNIVVDAPDTQTQSGTGACATRYVATKTPITITDLNSATPMKLQSCTGGNFAPVRQTNATTASVTANDFDFKWCFIGEDKTYRISFQGDQFSGRRTYNWIATPDENQLGFYNVRDFGAKGDGRTDDTVAIMSAVAFIAGRNGGRLVFPDGDYIVGNAPEYPNFEGIALPSGITIEGTGSLNTSPSRNNVVQRSPTRITLKGANRAIFRIGECTERVIVRDIELNAEGQQANTYGIEAVGAFISSQDMFFDRVAFTNFYRGIYAHFLPANNSQWQFDFVKVNNCRFLFNRDAGIWVDLWNTDWAVKGGFFVMPPKRPNVAANGIYAFHIGALLVEDTFAGGGYGAGNAGGDFIHLVESNIVTIIGSQSEQTTRDIAFGDAPGAGNLGAPMTLINNVFGTMVDIKGRRNIVSVGNHYGVDNVKLHPDARVYSTGDRFCYDGYILGCQRAVDRVGFVGGKIIFSTGQPAEGSVPGTPTVFGHDVQFDAPVRVQNVPFNQLPARNVGNGAFLYCTNCRRGTAPCQAGGSGSPAMQVGGRWECL